VVISRGVLVATCDAITRAMWAIGSQQQALLANASSLQQQNEVLAAVLHQLQQASGTSSSPSQPAKR